MINVIDIHTIMCKLAQSARCNECNIAIPVYNIKITNLSPEKIYFDVTCRKCEQEFVMEGSYEKSYSEEYLSLSASEKIAQDAKWGRIADSSDWKEIQAYLANFDRSGNIFKF